MYEKCCKNVHTMSQVTIHKPLEVRQQLVKLIPQSEETCKSSKENFITFNLSLITAQWLRVKSQLKSKYSEYSSKLTNSQLTAAFLSPTVEGQFTWKANDPKNDLVSENGKDLVIKNDGYYYLNFQVTLLRDKSEKCPCNGTSKSECKVSLEWSGEPLLQGWINANTCSTGLLGKVMKLTNGDTLKFTIDMPPNKIIEDESVTHLDIICMLKAQMQFRYIPIF